MILYRNKTPIVDLNNLSAYERRSLEGLIEIEGVPSGVLEMGIGAAIGYLLGEGRGQPIVGALIGILGGAVLSKIDLTGSKIASGTLVAPVPAAPGTTPTGATPDKNPGSFDWGSAIGVVNNLLFSKNEKTNGESVYDSIKKIWGSKTAQKSPDAPKKVLATEADIVAPPPPSQSGYAPVDPQTSGFGPSDIYGDKPRDDGWATYGANNIEAPDPVWYVAESTPEGTKLSD